MALTFNPITGQFDVIKKKFVSDDFVNGTFKETFNALVTSDGATTTLTVTNASTGNLTEQFSSGNTTFTGGSTIALTAGSDVSPTDNYIYILQSNPGTLVKSTSAFPTSVEHIKVGFFLVPSAGFTQTHGVYINQNWNDHLTSTDNQGHMAHIAERSRRDSAYYFSGIDGNGAQGYLTPIAGNVDFKSTSGVIYQMHRHSHPAHDTSTGDIVLVKNWNGNAFHDITNLYDIVADSTGATITNNKYFNLVIWAVANKSGEFGAVFINLPSGFYNTQANAEGDVLGFDDFTMPREFALESSTGFLIARITIRMKTGGGTWEVFSTTDLRGRSPVTASGGAASTITNFADNVFTIFDETDNTKVVAFDVGASVTTGTTRTLKIPNASEKIILENTDITGNIQFANKQAVDMVRHKGATFPDDPVDGQIFYHTPTGRTIIYTYDGTAAEWCSEQSIGSMTVFVDRTNGSDDLEKGTGVDSDAFQTIQFAFDAVPGLVGGNVIININNETYAETIVINGKNFTNYFTITLQGTLSQQASATQDSSVQGSGATQGSITDAGAFGSFDDLLIYSSNNDEYRLIDSDTSNIATIVNIWSAAPTGTYTVYDWGTTIQSSAPIEINKGQKGIVLKDIKFDGNAAAYTFRALEYVEVIIERCAFTSTGRVVFDTYSRGVIYQSLFTCFAANRNFRVLNSSVHLSACKFIGQSTNDKIIMVDDGSRLGVSEGTIVDGASLAGIDGIAADRQSKVICTPFTGFPRIRNCNRGLRAQVLSLGNSTSNNQYSGNTTDESVDATSVID